MVDACDGSTWAGLIDTLRLLRRDTLPGTHEAGCGAFEPPRHRVRDPAICSFFTLQLGACQRPRFA